MSTVTVTARRWEHGWELEIGPDRHTQVATLDQAVGQVRDYLDTVDPEIDHGDWVVEVIPELGPLGGEVARARQATADADAAQRAAAKRSRQVARDLRAAGYSVTDAAAILGVSRGRVSQLTGRVERGRA